jgi:hypothetical protein
VKNRNRVVAAHSWPMNNKGVAGEDSSSAEAAR